MADVGIEKITSDSGFLFKCFDHIHLHQRGYDLRRALLGPVASAGASSITTLWSIFISAGMLLPSIHPLFPAIPGALPVPGHSFICRLDSAGTI